MISKITKIISLCLICLSIMGCHRQKLEDIFYTKALIPVIIDWETRALLYVNNDPNQDLYSASVWLFPTVNSEYQGAPIEYKLSNPEYGYIEVPVGEFNVLVFNKTIGDYSDNVDFRGTDKFETFEYYVNSDSRATLFSKGDSKDEPYLYPEMLAAWSTYEGKTLNVTLDMISSYEIVSRTRSRVASSKGDSDVYTKVTKDDLSDLDPDLLQLTDIVTERLVHNITTVVKVENVRSASSAEGSLKGMSKSVKLATKEYSTETVTHNALFTNRIFTDDEKRDGELSTNYNVIGPLETDSNYSYEILFTLVDDHEGSIIYPTPPTSPFISDVSSQVNDAIIGLDKHIDININETIHLPDVSISNGDGFDITVDGWGDDVIIPINQ